VLGSFAIEVAPAGTPASAASVLAASACAGQSSARALARLGLLEAPPAASAI
jgi:hypothetical protein